MGRVCQMEHVLQNIVNTKYCNIKWIVSDTVVLLLGIYCCILISCIVIFIGVFVL